MSEASNFSLVLSGVKAGRLSVAAEAQRMLAFVAELSEPAALAEAKAQASAIEEYLAHRRDGTVEEYNAAVKIRARVEHRLGEVLAETVVPRGNHRVPGVGADPSIPECLGDTASKRKHTSSRAQRLAAVPWKEIETVIDTKTGKGKKASLAGVVREARNGHDATARVERTAYDSVSELCADARRRLKAAQQRFGVWPDAVADMGPQTRYLLYRDVRSVMKCFRELERELRRAGGGTAPDRKGVCNEGD